MFSSVSEINNNLSICVCVYAKERRRRRGGGGKEKKRRGRRKY
jgi:hypothetical protein